MADYDFPVGWGIAGLVGGALLARGGLFGGNNYVAGSDAGMATAALLASMNNRGTQYATSNEVQRGFDNQNSMANQREILTAITNGTAQGVATTNQTFHDTLSVLQDKYGEVTRDIAALAVQNQQMLANQNKCCCDTLRAIDNVVYTNSLNTDKILSAMSQNTIDTLRNQNNQLFVQNQLNGVIRWPQAATFSAGVPPIFGGPIPFGPFA